MKVSKGAEEKIRELYKDTTECIPYPRTNPDGYGSYQPVEHGKKMHYLIHRVAYQLFTGENIISSDIICHHCDNPACCNPKHLFKGTHTDNVRDKVAKGRQAKGEQNGRYTHGKFTKEARQHRRDNPAPAGIRGLLPEKDVKEAKRLLKLKISYNDIAAVTNIPYNTLKDIARGKSYAWVVIP